MSCPAVSDRVHAPLCVHESPDRPAQVQAVVACIVEGLQVALAQRGRALLMVSGGKSPVPLFEALSEQDLEWSKVHISLVDERVVPPTELSASNAALVQTHLRRGAAAASVWWPWVRAEDFSADGQCLYAPSELAARLNADLEPAPWPADVLVLGMGEDGHTASLFPGAAQAPLALQTRARVCALSPPASSGAAYERLTLTLDAILAARQLVLPLQGRAKRAVLAQALQAPSDRLPISHVLHRASQPLHIWLAP